MRLMMPSMSTQWESPRTASSTGASSRFTILAFSGASSESYMTPESTYLASSPSDISQLSRLDWPTLIWDGL